MAARPRSHCIEEKPQQKARLLLFPRIDGLISWAVFDKMLPFRRY